MNKKVAFITTGHPPFDDRIYWKFAVSISSKYSTAIFCSTEEISIKIDNIDIYGFYDKNISRKNKTLKLFELLRTFSPNIIICCEISAILPAYKYKKTVNNKCKIICDITEWYPENVVLKKTSFIKYFLYPVLFLTSVYLLNKCDLLIIGERSKYRRYEIIAPFKEKLIIGYYPVLKYFTPSYLRITDELVLCYAGLINFDRGILTLLDVANKLADRHPEIKIKLKLVGKFEHLNEEAEFDEMIKKKTKIQIEKAGWKNYNGISDCLKDVHICFDLRKRDFIYRNSLPIKIFEYMACGKPFIFSDVQPIKDEMNSQDFGFLVDPDNVLEIINYVEKYLMDTELYSRHSINGRLAIEGGKSWENESQKLINLISNLV